MSTNLNYSRFLGKHPHEEIHTPKQMEQQRDHTMMSLPCRGINDGTDIRPEPKTFGAMSPTFGNQRGPLAG